MRLGATSSGGTRSNRGLVPLLGLLVASGCSTTRLGAATTQPNPLVAFPNQATHRSQKLYIDVRDMDPELLWSRIGLVPS